MALKKLKEYSVSDTEESALKIALNGFLLQNLAKSEIKQNPGDQRDPVTATKRQSNSCQNQYIPKI